MSRYFSRATGESISIGDIAGARFQQASAWTVMWFMRVDTVDGTAESTPLSKYDANQQFFFRVNNGTAPVNCDVRTNGSSIISGGSETIAEDTWYLVAITCNGTASADDVALFIYDMSAATLSGYNGVTGTHAGDDAGLTDTIRFGARSDATPDYFDGDLAHQIYVTAELSQAEHLAFLRQPTRTAAAFKALHGVEYYFPLGFASPETEHSGAAITGTLSGTPDVSQMPPTGGFSRIWGGLLATELATLEQEGYRWRNDDGSESGASWRQSQDTSDTVAKNTNIRLRALLNATGDPAAATYQLEYKESGDPDAEYRAIPL
jgi:hypothetical protein